MHRINSASFFLALSLFTGRVTAVHDALVARQATPSSSSSTASASTIPIPPDLFFQTIPQAVTCKPLTFSWFYNGLNGVFTFDATNAGVSQASTPPPLTTPSTSSSSLPISASLARRAVPTGVNPGPLSVPIATNIAGSKSEFTWPAVSVPQGWYVINATMASPQYTVASSAFYVHTGTDTSCLVSVASSTPSSGSTSSTSATPASASSVRGAKKGVVIGVSVGVVALVAALFSAWIFCLHRRSKKSAAPGSGGEFPKGLAHRWNGLASTDSRGITGGGVGRSFSHGHRPYRADSIGSIQMTPSEEAVSVEKNSEGKFDDESTSTGHGLALSYLPVLQQNSQTPRAKASTVGRTFSISSSASEHGFQSQNGHYTPAPALIRRPSVHDSTPAARRSTESTTYPPASPTRKNSTHAPPSKSTAQYNMMYPSLPTSPQSDNDNNNNNAMSPAGPASPGEGGARLTNRQSLKRKPVPAYDPNDNPSSPAVSQVPPVTSPVSVPPNPSSTPDSSTVNVANGGAHYATRNQLEQDPNQPTLIHKSSFGPGGVEGKPLHYLIPDMPMPVRG